MDQFVCVRLVKCNDLDLKVFQFDFDLTFAITFLNADNTIYGRYGTRTSMQNSERDVSVEGLAASLQEVLKLHNSFEKTKETLKGKSGIDLGVKKPEDFKELSRFRSELDYEGQVSKSCIHCHQVGDALRNNYRRESKPLPDRLMFPFPPPKTIGMRIDPKSAASIVDVDDNSPVAQSGIMSGDRIISIDNQPIVSTADVQWILHHSDAVDSLKMVLDRDGKTVESVVNLESGWRRNNDVSWRPTSWNLRRLATGGIRFKALSDGERKRLAIDDGKMALLAEHVGLYGNHALAHRAGVKKGDIVIGIDGKTDLMTETDVLYHSMQQKKPGDEIELAVVRGDKQFTIKFRLP